MAEKVGALVTFEAGISDFISEVLIRPSGEPLESNGYKVWHLVFLHEIHAHLPDDAIGFLDIGGNILPRIVSEAEAE